MLVFADPTGTPISRLAVAEAQHVVAAAGRQRGPQPVDEPRPIVVLEDVKETAVEDRVELLPEGGQLESIPFQEASADPALVGLPPGGRERRGRRVDPGGVESQGGSHQGVLSRPTSDVEDPAHQPATVGELDEGGLGPTDVPGRRPRRVESIEVLRPPRLTWPRQPIGAPALRHSQTSERQSPGPTRKIIGVDGARLRLENRNGSVAPGGPLCVRLEPLDRPRDRPVVVPTEERP